MPTEQSNPMGKKPKDETSPDLGYASNKSFRREPRNGWEAAYYGGY